MSTQMLNLLIGLLLGVPVGLFVAFVLIEISNDEEARDKLYTYQCRMRRWWRDR